MSDRKTYLGDGAYAELDRFGCVTLSTERAEATHYIVLEPDVLVAFERFIAAARQRAASSSGGSQR